MIFVRDIAPAINIITINLFIVLSNSILMVKFEPQSTYPEIGFLYYFLNLLLIV